MITKPTTTALAHSLTAPPLRWPTLVTLWVTLLLAEGAAATFSDANWVSLGGSLQQGTDGRVEVTAVDASGVLYIGGAFSNVANTAARGVARWDGTHWSALGAGIVLGAGERIHALLPSGGDLYAAGTFRKAGGVTVNGIARWDGTAWSALGTGINLNSGIDAIRSLASTGGQLYAGGSFGSIGGVAATNIARWNGTSWSAVGPGVGYYPALDSVDALWVSADDLIVGGRFQTAGGVTAHHVARWNGTQWSAVGPAADWWESVPVVALANSGSDLYAVGDSYHHFAHHAVVGKWDGISWSLLGTEVTGPPRSLAATALGLYLAVGAELWNWSGTTWTRPVSNIQGQEVLSLLGRGGTMYVGGSFIRAGIPGEDIPALNLARWDGSHWSVPGVSGLNNWVPQLAAFGNELYAGGDAIQVGPHAPRHVARWTGTDWAALGNGVDGPVWAVLATSSNSLYVSGAFTNAGGTAAHHIARWDGTSWSPLGSGVTPDALGYANIYAMAAIGHELHVGGAFSSAGGIATTNLAKWDGTHWSSIGSAEGFVFCLAASGSTLYAAGSFDRVGGIPASRVARWDGTRWEALGSGPPNWGQPVRALAVSGTRVYIDNPSEAGVLQWDGATWTKLPFQFAPWGVYAMVADGDDLYLAGGFESVTFPPNPAAIDLRYLARWNGTQLDPLGSGMNAPVDALALARNTLYAGGLFTTAGGKTSAYAAKAILRPAEGRFENPSFTPGTGFRTTFTDGSEGQRYRIQTAPALTSPAWADYTNFTYSTPLTITLPPPMPGSNQFLRAVSP